MPNKITVPLTREAAERLRVGDRVLLSGTVYAARDAAHRRLAELIQRGGALPIPLDGTVIYYVGPSPAPPGYPIGAAGPTTSSRMDAYTPALLRLGLCGMIGKGRRSAAVVAAMRETGAVYFGAIGGAGALLAACVTAAEPVCWQDLGPEALVRLTVVDLPLTVVIDSAGEDLYELGPARYRESG